MTQASEQDTDLLELYLDRELPADEAARIESRLVVEPALQGELERLRGQRSRRLSAMSFAFDTNSDTVERLVASVRAAQASEALTDRRRSTGWLRPALSAAACIAFGLGLGVVLHKQHGGGNSVGTGAITAVPIGATNTGAMNISLEPQGRHIVSVRDGNGHELMRVDFPTQQEAQAFIDDTNRAAAGATPSTNIRNTQVMERPY